MTTRRFHCSEADYLTDRGVPLAAAIGYCGWYGPASIVRLHHAGITPEQANADRLSPEEIACRFRHLQAPPACPAKG